MSAQLGRLQAFLAGAGELEVVAPAPAIRPDYFGRFAKLLGATVVATHLASPTATAHVPAPVPVATAAVAAAPALRDRATTQSSILSVRKIAARYLADGRSPLKPVITMRNPDDDLDAGPIAMALPGGACAIDGVRDDYSKIEQLASVAATPEHRAQVLVHEAMHCRLGPALLRFVAREPAAANFAVMFSESSADAMAILTVARKDGVPAALRALDHWYQVRDEEAASPDTDGHHDSREALVRIRDLLTLAPEKVDSDGAAFALAITEGLVGASKTFAAWLPADRKDYIASAEFKAQMTGFHEAVEEMARGYLEGPYELGAPEVKMNDQMLPAGAPATASAWQLLAKKLGPPAFTPLSLRQQAEAISQSVVASASASTSSAQSPALPTAAAAPAAVALRSDDGVAIGRLRSYLSAIYVDPVRAEDPSPDVDQSSTWAPAQLAR